MLFLIFVLWYACGIHAAYRTLRVIGGAITNGDVVMMLVAGLLGPIGWFHWMTYSRGTWADRPSRWFK